MENATVDLCPYNFIYVHFVLLHIGTNHLSRFSFKFLLVLKHWIRKFLRVAIFLEIPILLLQKSDGRFLQGKDGIEIKEVNKEAY